MIPGRRVSRGDAFESPTRACYHRRMASKKSAGGDLTTQILLQIRDEIRSTNKQLGGLNDRVDTLNEQVDTLNERVDRLESRQAEDSIRLGTELLAVARAVVEVRDLLREQRLERERLDNHERRLTAIERKIA